MKNPRTTDTGPVTANWALAPPAADESDRAVGSLEHFGCSMATPGNGGDFHDFLELGPGRRGIVLGDVSSEGIQAAWFAAEYVDATRSLRYANCGHYPPFLLHADGAVDRLHATASFAGLSPWTRETPEVRLGPGDVLVIFSDGVVESVNREGDRFGEHRLLTLSRALRHRPMQAMAEGLVACVRVFTEGIRHHHLTVVTARVSPAG